MSGENDFSDLFPDEGLIKEWTYDGSTPTVEKVILRDENTKRIIEDNEPILFRYTKLLRKEHKRSQGTSG